MTQLVRLITRPSRDGKRFSYCLDYKDENSKRRRKSLGHADKRKAERQRAQFERELRMGIVVPGSLKLSEMLKDYRERVWSQVETSTLDSATYRMHDFISAIGDIEIDKITYGHCEKFVNYCIGRGLGQSSVNTHIKMVKRIFSLAVKRGQLEKNPFDGLSLFKIAGKQVRLLNDKEFHRLLRVMPNLLWKSRFLLSKTAGLRRGEVLNLTINDVDFEKNKIIVQPKPETKTTWRWVVKDKERREVPLVPELAQLLVDIQTALPEGQPYLLLSPERYQHLIRLKDVDQLIDRVCKCPDNNFRRNWMAICKRVEIEDLAFHDLRATCITEWFEQGMMPHEVMYLAGHSSIDTTMKYYVGIRQSMLERARTASQRALGEDFGTHLARTPENREMGTEKAATT